jgi:hypothetical protein
MKFPLTNISCIMTGVVLAAIGSIMISVYYHDWTWFNRAGGVIVLLGGLLATRRIIRLGVKELFKADHTTSGGHIVPTPEEVESDRQDRLDIWAAKCAFWVVSAGTIIGAFDDLLGRFYDEDYVSVLQAFVVKIEL